MGPSLASVRREVSRSAVLPASSSSATDIDDEGVVVVVVVVVEGASVESIRRSAPVARLFETVRSALTTLFRNMRLEWGMEACRDACKCV